MGGPTFEGPDLDDVEGIGALTLGGFLDEVVAAHGPAEAIVLDDDLRDGATVRWTYDDLGREAGRVGRGLLAAGVEPGDTVAVVLGNRPEAVAALFGAASIGAVVALISTFAAPPELAELLVRSDPKVVLTQARLRTRKFGDEVAGVGDGLASAPAVAVVGEPSWDELLRGGDAVDDEVRRRRVAAVRPDDPALVIFSSGTTSEPKGVVHGHRSPALQFWTQARLFARGPDTRIYSALPIFWTAGLNTAVGSTLAAGGCWVAQEVFEPAAALALLARERVTEPYTLPHQTAALAEHPDWVATDLSAVRCAYGKGAYARHPSVDPDSGWVMPVGYGLSETCAFVSGYASDEPREQVKVGNGRLLPGTRLRVVDPDTDRILGVDEDGELAVAGATLMLGYLGMPPEGCFDDDGFFRTGDAGHVDADGIVHYTGRRTEMIKTGGANVSPAELEVALRAHPLVKLSRVIGIDDERLGQLVVACIVRRDGLPADDAADAESIRTFLRERVAAYKVPKRVLFLAADEVPMTDSGTKVRDDALVPLVLERVAATDLDRPPAVPTS